MASKPNLRLPPEPTRRARPRAGAARLHGVLRPAAWAPHDL